MLEDNYLLKKKVACILWFEILKHEIGFTLMFVLDLILTIWLAQLVEPWLHCGIPGLVLGVRMAVVSRSDWMVFLRVSNTYIGASSVSTDHIFSLKTKHTVL